MTNLNRLGIAVDDKTDLFLDPQIEKKKTLGILMFLKAELIFKNPLSAIIFIYSEIQI